MVYELIYSNDFIKSIKKLKKKDPQIAERIIKKLDEIIDRPKQFKPLKNVLAGYKRIHFGSFVLIFTIKENTVILVSLDHHDKAY